MSIQQKEFTRYHLDKQQDTFTIKLNPQERKELEEWKKLILQDKDSTAMKHLARLGAKVLQQDFIKLYGEILLGNYRKNKRLNIVKFD